MLKATVVYARQGDFIILNSVGEWFIGVLIPNFNSNSHFDISRYYTPIGQDLNHIREPYDYFRQLADDIRRNPNAFSHREVHNFDIDEVR